MYDEEISGFTRDKWIYQPFSGVTVPVSLLMDSSCIQ